MDGQDSEIKKIYNGKPQYAIITHPFQCDYGYTRYRTLIIIHAELSFVYCALPTFDTRREEL